MANHCAQLLPRSSACCRPGTSTSCYFAGLLHDIGLIVRPVGDGRPRRGPARGGREAAASDAPGAGRKAACRT
ncbi:MAG: hypothetical protein MZV70_71650 [Desulfobacterales bacterium]|nr:hypothetical protein [Desulfobacterales bacterium]